MIPCTFSGSGKSLMAALAQHADELLGIERVAAGPREQRGLRLGRQDAAVEQAADQPRRLGSDSGESET